MKKILVVDDTRMILDMIESALTHAGHTVRTAPDGKEALKIASEWAPDLVITDLVMPEKEGMQLIQELRRCCPWVRRIPSPPSDTISTVTPV